MNAADIASKARQLKEILPKAGLVYCMILFCIFNKEAERGNISEVLSKPKIMPIKSITLEKIEKMERDALMVQNK